MRIAAPSLAVAGLVVLAGSLASTASAAVVYSGVLNLSVPGTFDGTYLNVVSGLATPTTTGNTDYDFNPYIATPGTSTSWSFFQPDSTSGGTVAATTSGPALVLTAGTPIGPASVFKTGTAVGTAFNSSTAAYVGFKFLLETDASIHYGWARVSLPTPTLGAGGQAAGTIIDYAYDSSANTEILAGAGVVPEPTSIAALSLGGLLLRRRRV
jgi:hypothetical protein